MTPEEWDLVQQLIGQAVDLAVARIGTARRQSATVLEFSPDAADNVFPVVRVHLDGDPPDQYRTVTLGMPSAPRPGDRVLVDFDPPFGAVVLGSLSDGGRRSACAAGKAYLSASFEVADDTSTPLPWDEWEIEPCADEVSLDATTGYLTVNAPGTWIVGTLVKWEDEASAGTRTLTVDRQDVGSGSWQTIGPVEAVATGSIYTYQQVLTVASFATGDQVRVSAHQVTGGNLLVAGASPDTGFVSQVWMSRVCDCGEPVEYA